MLDVVQCNLFPNFGPFSSPTMSLVYNFRPHGSDPFKSVMEVMLLGPGTPGADAPRVSERRLADDEDYHNVPELRSEEHTSELQSLMRISYAVICLKQKI